MAPGQPAEFRSRPVTVEVLDGLAGYVSVAVGSRQYGVRRVRRSGEMESRR